MALIPLGAYLSAIHVDIGDALAEVQRDLDSLEETGAAPIPDV